MKGLQNRITGIYYTKKDTVVKHKTEVFFFAEVPFGSGRKRGDILDPQSAINNTKKDNKRSTNNAIIIIIIVVIHYNNNSNNNNQFACASKT